MAVPVGFTAAGRPVAFWLAAGFLDEPRLIAVGSAIESFFAARTPPRLVGAVPPEPPDAGLCGPSAARIPAPADRDEAARAWRSTRAR